MGGGKRKKEHCLKTSITLHFTDISTEPTAKKAKAQASRKPASSKLEPTDKGKPLPAADETWRAKLRQKVAEAKATPVLCSRAEVHTEVWLTRS
jgi:hypothetical protein